MKKLIVHVMIAVTILFGCYNLIWYFGAYKPYDELQDNFPEIEESGVKIYADKWKSGNHRTRYSVRTDYLDETI